MSKDSPKRLALLIVDSSRESLARIAGHPSIDENGWTTVTAASVEQASEKLKSEKIDIVVTQLKLADGHGGLVLAQAKRDIPNALRFVISESSDKDALPLVTGLAHRYLEAPISPEEVAWAIKIVLKTQLRIRRSVVANIVRETKQLHVNTEPMQELLRTADDPECDIDGLAQVISKHPTAVATALQVANTAFFGSGGRIETIEEALQLLGMDFVRNLAITELAKKQLALSPGLQEIANAILQHSIQTSQYGYQLREHVSNVKLIQTLCSLALLHDLGKLVLLANDGNNYADILGRSIDTNRPSWNLEQGRYQCDHAAVGGFLFAMWGLPEIIVRAVTWHHEPLAVSRKEFCPVSLLHYANYAAHTKNEMSFYCGDELNTELARMQGMPRDFARELD